MLKNFTYLRNDEIEQKDEIWDHMYCQCSQQNIFQHFEKHFAFLFYFSKIALISETVRDETIEIWDIF